MQQSIKKRRNVGKEAHTGNTSYTFDTAFFCSNLTKVDSLEHHVVSYDLKDIDLIRELCNTLHVEP